MVNLLSFDLEEYFHGPAFSHLPAAQWPRLRPRLPGNLQELLSILGEQKATFFVLGWVARTYPNLVRQIKDLGHEIACHGDMHRHIWDLSPREFREDLLAAKQALEDIIGAEIIGYRAPTFSVVKKTLWALPLIREAGFLYDSSIFPIRHDRYGIPDFPRQPFQILDDFWEIPLSTLRIFGMNFPCGGGGYLRLYPYCLTRFCLTRLHRENLPLVFYQHPWELDRSKGIMGEKPKSVWFLFRSGISLGSPKEKLKKMLQDYQFVSMADWLKQRQGS
jgi:polysaccharide deacetylase family protein (PEP-CTERM system associated)